MQSALVVAAPASPLEQAAPERCADCESPLGGELAPNVCASCSHPQPLRAQETYFSALGVPVRFAQEEAQLKSRFYALSRALHPDRFSGQGPLLAQRSLERMSFVNEAYTTLKDPSRLRPYLLEQLGVVSGQKPKPGASALPLELAETWFELQESSMEDPSGARSRAQAFLKELQEYHQRLEAEILHWEKEYDSKGVRSALEEIQKRLQTQSYLRSLERDVQQKAL